MPLNNLDSIVGWTKTSKIAQIFPYLFNEVRCKEAMVKTPFKHGKKSTQKFIEPE